MDFSKTETFLELVFRLHSTQEFFEDFQIPFPTLNLSLPKIVIIGSGFAGINALGKLLPHQDKAHITFISKSGSFLYYPVLQENVARQEERNLIDIPLPEKSKHANLDIIKAGVTSIDCEKKEVTYSKIPQGGSNSLTLHTENWRGVVSYDYLIIATGSRENDFGIPGVKEHALKLRSMRDAQEIYGRILELTLTHEPKILTIIGAGATGTEVVCTIHDYLIAHKIHTISIRLVTSTPEVLPVFNSAIRNRAFRSLQKKGIEIRANSRAIEVGKNSVTVQSQSESASPTANRQPPTTFPSDLTLWLAGVQAEQLNITPAPHLGAGKRIITDPTLRLHDFPDVFILGDQGFPCGDDGVCSSPTTAQCAQQQGIYAAKSIVNLIKQSSSLPATRYLLPATFKYFHKGTMISLGKSEGILQIGKLTISGRLAWLVWRIYHHVQVWYVGKMIREL